MGSPLGKSTSDKLSGTVCVNKLLALERPDLLRKLLQTFFNSQVPTHFLLPVEQLLSLSLLSNKAQTSNFFHLLSGTTNLTPTISCLYMTMPRCQRWI